jgi:hypothetical protein
MPFLVDHEPRPLTLASPAGFRPVDLFVGSGGMALEVALVEADHEPTVGQMRELHRERLGRRVAPVLIVVLWGENRAAICGGLPDDLSIQTSLPSGQVERLCRSALATPDRHGAIRYLAQTLPQLASRIPGLRNEGLFALHELIAGVPHRPDWSQANSRARDLLPLRGPALVDRLGFQARQLPGPASLLFAGETKLAVAVFLERPDEIDPPGPLFDGLSPVSYALAQADHERLDYVIVSAGSTLRVYPVKPAVGTGRRGRTETFVELNLDLLDERHAGYLWLLYSVDALADGGPFAQILATSEDYAADLSTRLRERVYQDVVPAFSRAIAEERRLAAPTAEQLAGTYDMALLVLFRLLFIAYAEDKELLPLHTSPPYREHSLKHMAQRLQDDQRRGVDWGAEDFYWNEVTQLWKAVDKGNPAWGVPQYNGGLFAEDGDTSAADVAAISLPDSAFASALASLLLDETAEGEIGPIDFRSLGVREFGTIYEGLLDSELSVADADLSVEPNTGAYVPVNGGAEPIVRRGEVYLHNASGARKSSGSYYTKSFAVEHLLDAALEPAVDDHFARLDALDDRQAAERFFEFRVADVAMGSGHFLVAAVDRVERRFSNYLAGRRLAGVTNELERLRAEAMRQLGDDWVGDPIEDTQLLRRQVARRCIFGVDLNPLAVELARLSIWIHTFVPGLPLSFLDQNLVVGNSLVGIGTFEEANEILAGAGDLFSLTAAERLARVREPLERLAKLTDATAAEVRDAKALFTQLRERTRPEAGLLTILTASRIDDEIAQAVDQGQIATLIEGGGDVFTDRLLRRAERALSGLKALHFPVTFPQVFLGDRSGFDVILGNPPWDKPIVDELGFWTRHFPGLRSLSQREREARLPACREARSDLVAALEEERTNTDRLREILIAGAYPGITAGHPDLYKAFVWRFWDLVSPHGGRIGVVLPRSALAAKGGDAFRITILETAELIDLTMLVNNRTWVFGEVHPQYTIGLTAITRRENGGRTRLQLRGPYASLEHFRRGVVREPVIFYGSEVKGWNDTASLPLLPSEESVAVFAQLRESPRLDVDDGVNWRARPLQGDLNSTTGKPFMDLESVVCPPGYWPVYKGASFDIWNADTGIYYGWTDPGVVLPELQERRGGATNRSAFAEFDDSWRGDPATLPCLRPRIAYRRVSRATDSRTVRVALVPGEVVLTDKASYFLWPRGETADEAYLLGVLSSIILDWYARRFVETQVDFFVINPFPIPRPPSQHPLRRRVVSIAGRLASIDERYAEWAASVGVAYGALETRERDLLVHELDATVACLYGLTEPHLVHIFETFHEGWDYQDRLDATVRHYNELRRHV